MSKSANTYTTLRESHMTEQVAVAPVTTQELASAFEAAGEMVREFHEVFEHPVGVDLTDSLGEVRVVERMTYINEELQEGLKAALARDAVEVVDAMGDAVYLLMGNLVECGAMSEDLEGLAKEVFGHLSNDEMGNVVQSVQLDIEAAGSLNRFVRTNFVRMQHLVLEEIESLMSFDKPEEESTLAIAPVSASLALTIMTLMKTSMSAEPMEVMSAIHQSNMSKLLPSELSDEEACREFMAANMSSKMSPDELTFTRSASGGWIAKCKSTGKIIKSPLYQAVDLAPLVHVTL